jgi:hypothetical protein
LGCGTHQKSPQVQELATNSLRKPDGEDCLVPECAHLGRIVLNCSFNRD